MPYKAILTLTHTDWSGWDGGHMSAHTARLQAVQGNALRPECVGLQNGAPGDSLSYEVTIEAITAHDAGFFYRRLVIDNPGGSINLTAPNFGRFRLRAGESQNLSTPTMDSGTSVVIALENIQEIVVDPA